MGLNVPKCLVKVGNYQIIHYLLKSLEDVPNIRIVIGFKEEEVIKVVNAIRKDIIFVRNPFYNTTTNSYSLHLGSFDLSEPFLNIDGDMLITKQELQKFSDAIEVKKNLIGITKAYTEDPVFVKLNSKHQVVQFSRDRISDYEWTGIAHLANIKIKKEGKYVYQEIEGKLPIKACEIECYEIDTPQDLQYVQNKSVFR